MANSAAAGSSAPALSGHIITVCLRVEAQPEAAAFFRSLEHLSTATSPYTHSLLGLVGENKIAAAGSSGGDGVTLVDQARSRLARDLELHHGARVHPVSLPAEIEQSAASYAGDVVLPIFQGAQSKLPAGTSTEKALTNFKRMNETFAETIMQVYKPGDLVIIHSPALHLLPDMLRAKLSSMYIGFVLHTPFPDPAAFPATTMQERIIGGMLGADLLAFTTASCTENFKDLCNKTLGVEAIQGHIEVGLAQTALLSRMASDNDDQRWTDKCIDELIVKLASANRPRNTPALDLTDFKQQYDSSARRLVLLDYDGTLTKIVQHANLAIPTQHTIDTLKTLTSDPRNTVWIISGRDQAFLSHHFGNITALGLSAEHGCFVRPPNSGEWENLAANFDMTWKDIVIDMFEECCKEAPRAWVERKKVGVTWHYREVVDQARAMTMAKLCQRDLHDKVVKKYEVEVMAGKANLEVRPRFINKGETVKKIVKAFGEGENEVPDFVFCAGDDMTDEDMFQKLRGMDGVFTVKVGPSSKPTLAKWHVEQPEHVVAAIAVLNR